MVNVSGDCYQGDPLQGIKRFVKIAGIPNLEKFFQKTYKRSPLKLIEEKDKGKRANTSSVTLYTGFNGALTIYFVVI
ncbi:hypothetical protein DRJ04_06125 [Candidatus Aerophobetes bacterium]|uniref:Uncharacterized protein n=1 Tax=Aerophobetes bacterium TaxID=2030807 RepID=A0A662D9P3_UNCAE|nr:MAG: hypothetical protein DRJ04_06125 [Candidatus Aerophobetes bacterium]